MTVLRVQVARFVQWFDRNEDNAIESWNEMCLFCTEHLPHFIGSMG